MSGHHTSWRLNAGDETSVMDSRNRKILRAECGGASGIKLAEAEANARLIAAAPDLLALVWQYESDLRHPPADDSVQRRLDRIATVLAKVERGQ